MDQEKHTSKLHGEGTLHSFWRFLLQRHSVLPALSAVQLTLFAVLTWWVHSHPRYFDEIKLTGEVTRHRSPFTRHVTSTFSYIIGSPATLNIGMVPLTLILWKARLRVEAMVVVLTNTVGLLVQKTIKRIVYRPRPDMIFRRHRHRAHKQSFPSGHTVTATTFWGWLLLLGLQHLKRRRGLLSLPIVFIGLIGPTRVYLGEHWLSDVLGGYLLGGTYLNLSWLLYRMLRAKRNEPGERGAHPVQPVAG